MLQFLAGGLVLALLAMVGHKVVQHRLAIIKFHKLTRGLPVLPKYYLLGNHTMTIAMGPENCELVLKAHKEMGLKTIGGLLGSRFGASTIDLDLIKTFIYDEPDSHHDRIKPNLPLEEFEDTILTAPKKEWSKLRRIVAPALTSNKFMAPNVVCELDESIDRLISHFNKKLDETHKTSGQAVFEFDAEDLFHRHTLNLIFKCFYKQDDAIDYDTPHEPWTRAIDNTPREILHSPIIKISVLFPVFKRAIDWMIWNLTPYGYNRKELLKIVVSLAKLGIEARGRLAELRAEAAKTGAHVDPNKFALKDGTMFKRNLADHLVDKFLDGELSKRHYCNESRFFMVAADKTTSACLTHTVYFIATNPNIQERLRESVLLEGAESEYLDWVLKESLRLYPPAPVGCSRSLTRDIEIEGGKYVLPAGTVVLTNSFVIHRQKEYWGEDAEEFKPERWRDTSNHHPFQYLPFGAGLRRCPGGRFALFEIKRSLVALLGRFKFEAKIKPDMFKFHAPWLVVTVPNSHTWISVRRL